MRILGFAMLVAIILFPTLSYSCGDEEKNAPRTDYISDYNAYENTDSTSYDFMTYGVVEHNNFNIPQEAIVATGIWSQTLVPVDNFPSYNESMPEDVVSMSDDSSVLPSGMSIVPLQ